MSADNQLRRPSSTIIIVPHEHESDSDMIHHNDTPGFKNRHRKELISVEIDRDNLQTVIIKDSLISKWSSNNHEKRTSNHSCVIHEDKDSA